MDIKECVTRSGAAIWVAICCAIPALHAQPGASNPPAPGVSQIANQEALAHFQVKPGFRVELVAAAPLVQNPVAITFDEEGNLYVAENEGLRPDARGARRAGRVLRLDDRDASGAYQASVVLADNLVWPAGLVFYQGGLFVAATPQIIYLGSVKKGGAAVSPRVVFDNLSDPAQPREPRRLIRNLTWGPDNRIHGLASRLTPPGGGAPALPPGHDFWFDPRQPVLRPEPGGSDSGLAFDNAGTRFSCSFDRPLQKTVYQDIYLERNPFFAAAPALVDSASAVAIFMPQSVDKTAPAEASAVRAPRATWMTNATGLAIYRGQAYPTNYLEDAFVADPVAGVVHRLVLRDAGVLTVADRAKDESASEFLAARDGSFHPIQVVNGPEGVLYVVDVGDEKHAGGILRVTPENLKATDKLSLGQATIVELAVQLAHPDGWRRDTAARLLCEKAGPETRRVVAGVLHQAKSPLARFHAFMVLQATQNLAETNVLRALRDTEPAIRQQGVQFSEAFIRNGAISDSLWNQLVSMRSDASILVRQQLALTLGGIQRPDRPAVLAGLLRRDLANPWMQTAVLASTPDGAAALLVGLAQDAAFRNDLNGRAFLEKLTSMIGVRGVASEVSQAIDLLAGNLLDQNTTFVLLRSLGGGLRRAGSALYLADTTGRLAPVFNRATVAALDESLSATFRANAIGAMEFTALGFAESGDLLLLLLGSGQPAPVQAAAISTLGGYNDVRVATNLVARLRALGPDLRRETVTALLTREERVGWTLAAAAQGQISWADFPLESLQYLRTHADPAIAGAAAQLFGGFAPRNAAIDQFLGALRLNAVAARGREIFRARCVSCHRLAGEGQDLGPDLDGAKVFGRQRLLFLILEPNAQVRDGFATHVLRTRTGEVYVGLLENPNSLTVTLVSTGGVRRVFPRANVLSIEAQPWSLMPEGLEAGLAPQDMANLLGYLLAPTR